MSGSSEHALAARTVSTALRDVGGGHTVAHFDAKRFSKLSRNQRCLRSEWVRAR